MAILLAFILTASIPGGPTTARGQDLLILIPALALISFVAAGFGVWAFRRLRFQRTRAELLASDLHHVREEARRRLNFLNAISHDLRTPLNGITLQTHILDHALATPNATHDSETLARTVAQIRASSDLAAEILDSLLQYARIDLDHNTLAPLRLRDFLPHAADPFRAAADEKSLAFSLTFVADPVLHTDRDKLQRILSNLLDNAVKFTHHGSISITVRPAEPVARLPSNGHPAPLPPAVRIDITDTGEGIAPEHLPHLFHEFFQANNPSRDARLGLGLGLVVAHRLALQLGGDLACTSTFRRGSTLTLTLPQVSPDGDS